ncbi:DNA-directed RNA polymerase subunit beta [Platanthera guangdongensis]|uniref:DNA-directed RNA polymerase subunit beta n=1 Tax=Platanthera guangdongensis TaxID=2320717 RepID=A0ABR2M1B3_9ASPA
MLTYKSNHITARQEVLGATIIGSTVPNPESAPESFRLLVRELRSLVGPSATRRWTKRSGWPGASSVAPRRSRGGRWQQEEGGWRP